jgi:hypothetical protein
MKDNDKHQPADRFPRLRDEIEQTLQKALDSGPSTPMTAADWARIRRLGKKRIAAKRRKQ